MTEVKRVDGLRNRRRYRELKEEAENEKDGNEGLKIEHKEDIQVIFHFHRPANNQYT